MDHLSYDLVEEVASYLPRKDVKTIARVAARSPALDRWSSASEDQLERRFLLDVHVILQISGEYPCVGDGSDSTTQISLSVQKRLSNGSREEWDFKNWRYAWIRDITIEASLRDDPGMYEDSEDSEEGEVFKESDIHQVLRLVSLPVDPSARTWLYIAVHSVCLSDSAYPIPRQFADILLKVAQNTQKDFCKVTMKDSGLGRLRMFDDLVIDFIERGPFLEKLFYQNEYLPQLDVCEAIAPLFGKRRGRPLRVYFEEINIEPEGVELIVDAWLQSDGTFEKKTIKFENYNEHSEDVWFAVKEKYKTVVQRGDPRFIGNPTESFAGYLAHPTKLSSLLISPDRILVVKFKPWHVPVDFEWIKSFISKWRKRRGFYVCKGVKKLFFHFKTDDDWLKLVEKYGPAVDEGSRLRIAHPMRPRFLEIEMLDNWFEVRTRRRRRSHRRLGGR